MRNFKRVSAPGVPPEVLRDLILDGVRHGSLFKAPQVIPREVSTGSPKTGPSPGCDSQVSPSVLPGADVIRARWRRLPGNQEASIPLSCHVALGKLQSPNTEGGERQGLGSLSGF